MYTYELRSYNMSSENLSNTINCGRFHVETVKLLLCCSRSQVNLKFGHFTSKRVVRAELFVFFFAS